MPNINTEVDQQNLISILGTTKIIVQWNNLIEADRKKLPSQFKRLCDDFKKNINKLSENDFITKNDKWKEFMTKVSKCSDIYKKSNPLNIKALTKGALKLVKESKLTIFINDLESQCDKYKNFSNLIMKINITKNASGTNLKKSNDLLTKKEKVKNKIENLLKKYDKKAFVKFKVTKEDDTFTFLVKLIAEKKKDLETIQNVLINDKLKKDFMKNLSTAAVKALESK